jgi:hypothetical protein
MEIPLLGMAADEVVKILRQMSQFSNRPIVLYSFYKIEELGSADVRTRAMAIEDAKVACIQAGANENIGRFNEFSFLEVLARYLKAEPGTKK